MPEMLRRELVVRPQRILARHLVAVGLGCGLIGAGASLVAHSLAAPPQPAAVLALTLPVVALPAPVASRAAPSVAPVSDPARAKEVSLVFSADGDSYAQIAALSHDEPRAVPAHGRLRLADGGGDAPHAAIAEVESTAVTAAQRAWLGRQLVVDGSCTATVTGFALVSRITGEPSWLGDGEATEWTAQGVWDAGALVLAAKLSDCDGRYARDAALSPIVAPTAVEAPALATAARAVLLASPAAIALRGEWKQAGMVGEWTAAAKLTSGAVRHPRTGETWVWTHAALPFDCGAPQGNLWGLFRVAADGTLRAHAVGSLGELHQVDGLLDLDDDGAFEVIGRSDLTADPVIATPDGDEIARLSVPFLGCPC